MEIKIQFSIKHNMFKFIFKLVEFTYFIVMIKSAI